MDDPNRNWYTMDELALNHGIFDEHNFYHSFSVFDNQSIEKSLVSDDLLVRIFAILDRRVGKRRLIAMQEEMKNEPEILQVFYLIRTEAENISVT